MVSKTMFSHNSDEWETPQALFDDLNAEFDFELDACASDDNHKCAEYYTIEQDGLKIMWGGGAARMVQSTLFQYSQMGRESI